MLVLVDLPEPPAVFLVLRVLLPVLLGTVRRPAAVRALELDGFRRSLGVRMQRAVFLRAHRAGSKRLDGLAACDEGGEGRLAERVEEVVLGEDGLLRLGLVRRGLFEPREERARVARPTSLQDRRPLAKEGLAMKCARKGHAKRGAQAG